MKGSLVCLFVFPPAESGGLVGYVSRFDFQGKEFTARLSFGIFRNDAFSTPKQHPQQRKTAIWIKVCYGSSNHPG